MTDLSLGRDCAMLLAALCLGSGSLLLDGK
jgi:hypothetical protein